MDVGIKKGYFLLNNKKHITRTGINLIGRNREATLIIKDASISQHHALLVILDDGRHYLSDFNSSNGTFLDSERLQPLRLYEVRQGAHVQFAEIKSTYFKVSDVVEVNTQGSESPRAADDTLFNAETQLIDGSIMSATLLENKTKGTNHVNDHGYSKLLEEDAASTSLWVNHTNEVDTNTCDGGSKSVEKVTDPMDDHGYHKKNQVTDIGGAPTPVETKGRERETIHDLPTQIMDKYDGGSNSSIHELPTQLMDAKNMEDSDGGEVLKEKVAQKPGSSSIHELPTQMIRTKANVLGVSDSKSVENPNGADLSKDKLDYDQTHPEADTEQNNTGDIIDETLFVTSPKKRQSPSDTDGNSADSFDFMQSVPQDFADAVHSLDTNTQQSELHVSQRSKNIRNVIESDDEADDFKVTGMRRTKKRNVVDSSQETEADCDTSLAKGKTVKSGPVIRDSDSETDAEIDVPQGKDDKEKVPSNERSDEKKLRVAFGRKLAGVQADSDSETDVEEEKTDDGRHKSTSNEVKTIETRLDSGRKNELDDSDSDLEVIKTSRAKKNVIESSDDTDAEDEKKVFERKLAGDGGTKPVQADSDSEIDVKGDISKDDRDKSTSNEVKTVEIRLDSGSKNEIDDSTKKNVIESSGAEDGKKALVEFERKLTGDGGTKAMQVDSDSETDVEIDMSKEEKANDGRGKSNEVKTVETTFDSDSDLELTKSSRTKKNAIESSDDTDAEDETNKTEKQIKVADAQEDSGAETDVECDILRTNEKTKIKITSGSNSELIGAGRANETDVAAANEESINDQSQTDLFTTTKIDEEMRDEDEPEKKSENANSRLDDTDVIPPTQNSFVGDIDFDFNTQDLNYAAAKLKKARKENPREKDHSLNSEEPLGDSFSLALSASVIEQPGHENLKYTDDLFLQATQKNTEDGNIFLKPIQNVDADDDDIYIQPTQRLSENQCNSEEILLQPQIIVTEKCLGTKSNDDGVFLKPTQKLAVGGNIEEKLEDIFRPTQPDDDSIFLEATQKFPEKKKQDETTFLRPAQVGDVVRKSKLQIQAEDNIFMQATQITPVDKVEKIEPNLSTNKKKVADEVQKTTPIDNDVFLQATQVVTNDFKEDPPKTLPHSVESQLEVMFASQSVKLAEDENPRPVNPLGNLFSSLEVQAETIEINDDLPEAASSKEDERNDDADLNAPRRSSRRKSPQLSNVKGNVKNTRSTRSIPKKLGDVPAAPSDEEKIDLLFKSTIIMENDVFSESEEPVGRRTRRSPHPPDSLDNNENPKSLRKKAIRTPLATVEERPESPSKLDVISTPPDVKVSAGQQSKLQSKKRNVKITKIVDDVGEGTSVEQDVKPGRSRRCRAKGDLEKNQEDINANHKTECAKIVSVDDETPHRSTKRTRNKTETVGTSDNSSNDFDEPIRSESPGISRKTTRNRTVTKIKGSEERTASTESKKPEGDQKTDVKLKKRISKRTNSIVDDEEEENSVKNVKRTRIDSGSIESETPSTSKRTKSRRMQSVISTSDDEFAPSVAKKTKKNVADDDDSESVKAQSSAKSIPGTPTRKKLLQLQGTPLSTPERLKRKLKPKVAFTMLDSPELESLIRSLGGSVVDTVDACTVLVTGGVKRSQKLLSAVGLAKPICSPKWLQECRKASSFVDPWDHILVDEEAETKWQFSLKESLHRSTEMKLFENYTVHLIVSNAQDVLKGAIESCGGKCVTRAPPKNSATKYVIVSAQENKSKYAKFLKQTPRPMMVTAEAIFDGVLRQELRFEEHRLT